MSNISGLRAGSNVDEVLEIQNLVFGLNSTKSKNEDYIKDLIKELEDFRHFLYTQEQFFYRKIKVNNLDELERRLEVLRSSNFNSLVNSSETEFDDIVDLMYGVDWSQPVRAYFTDSENQKDFVRILTNKLDEENGFVKAVQRITNSGYKDKKSLGNTGAFVDFGKSLRVNEKGQLDITINPNLRKNAVTFSLTGDVDLPSHWVDRLRKDYGFVLETAKGNGLKRFEKWCYSKMPEELKPYFKVQFDNLLNRYDLILTNRSSIKGFLGELHATITLNYLMGRTDAVIPTGKLRDFSRSSKPEIPIDIFFKGFGFQVKNYDIENDTMYFGNGLNNSTKGQGVLMGNFIENRLRPEQDIADLLESFFSSYQFNQPIKETFKKSADYNAIYERFTETQYLNSIFSGYIHNIMRVSDVFQSSRIFTKKKTYYNTFFIVQGRFIPSSAIIQAVIDVVNNIFNEEIDFGMTYHNTPVLPPIDTDKAVEKDVYGPGHEEPTNINNLINKVRLTYSIRLDLKKIVNEAYKKVIIEEGKRLGQATTH